MYSYTIRIGVTGSTTGWNSVTQCINGSNVLSDPAALVTGSLFYVSCRVVLCTRSNDVTRAISPGEQQGRSPPLRLRVFPPRRRRPSPVMYIRPSGAAVGGRLRVPTAAVPYGLPAVRLGGSNCVVLVDGSRPRTRRPSTVRPAGFRHSAAVRPRDVASCGAAVKPDGRRRRCVPSSPPPPPQRCSTSPADLRRHTVGAARTPFCLRRTRPPRHNGSSRSPVRRGISKVLCRRGRRSHTYLPDEQTMNK